MTIEFWEVGGCVRDEILGLRPKDIDFTVVAPSFEAMCAEIAGGMKIVQFKPEFGTVRAVAGRPFRGHTGGLDFVWARREGPYSDGRHPDFVEPGTLLDDLARRDFTMNAVAKAADGTYIDHFRGIQDISDKRIICVGEAEERLFEDALRGLRALRFSITKGFDIDFTVQRVLHRTDFHEALSSVSKERQREEVEKMFATDTMASLLLFQRFRGVAEVVFSDGLRLSATMKG